jgi:hypothetical protein
LASSFLSECHHEIYVHNSFEHISSNWYWEYSCPQSLF